VKTLLEQFPQIHRYPEKERRITGLLFGEYISKFLHNERLALALRCVLESLQSNPNGGMFRFGVLALQQFVQRLPQLPPHYSSQSWCCRYGMWSTTQQQAAVAAVAAVPAIIAVVAAVQALLAPLRQAPLEGHSVKQ
jgi:CCR4-NOT transcription complex subunit 1 TTP binding domain